MEKWEAITKDTLKRLSYDEGLPDSIIAERYGVTVGQVRYKRKMFGLSMRDKIMEKMFDDFAAGKGELFKQLNSRQKNVCLRKKILMVLQKP